MKKVLIGLGIGCGSLLVLGIIALVAGGFWAKSKMEEYGGDLQAIAEQGQAQEQKITQLNEKFAFTPPKKGLPVKLEDDRVQQYLAVRAALQPVWKTYEEKAKELEGGKAGQPTGMGDAFKAMGMLSTMLTDLRSTWLTQLESKKMSPREYHAITAALYTSNWGSVANEMRQGQRQMVEQMKTQLEEQLAQASDPEMKRMLQEQLDSTKETLKTLPATDAMPSEAEALHKSNKALFDKYKTQIEENAAQGLDFLLVGGDDDHLGNAFDQIDMGYGDQEPAE